MNRASTLWKALEPDALALLGILRAGLEAQGPTPAWTAGRLQEAEALVVRIQTAWEQERVDLDGLRALKEVTAHLDLANTVTCRAALEAVHGHLRRIVELTGDELALDG